MAKKKEGLSDQSIVAQPVKSGLQKANALGDDTNLYDNGSDRRYWYSIGDGFRLLKAIRQDKLIYIREDESQYAIKAPGEENVATRESRERILVTDPYYIDNFASSLDDDIKTITASHTEDEYGANQRAKNNLWSQMPQVIVIPLLTGMHWRSIRVQINYATRSADILYDDPYGSRGFSDSLIEQVEPVIKRAIKSLISKQDVHEAEIEDIPVIRRKKKIDQQGAGENGYDCGPITFGNIVDYAISTRTNEQFISTIPSLYTISLAADPGHEEQMVGIRARDVETYERVSDIELPVSSVERIEQIKQLLRSSAERKKAQLDTTIGSTLIAQISRLPDEICAFIFSIIDNKRLAKGQDTTDGYTEEELSEAYTLVTDMQTESADISSFRAIGDGVDRRLVSKAYDTLTADGLRKSLHGNLYQLGLLTLVALRAKEANKQFYLISEAQEFEKFDDLVIDYVEDITFLQVKHSADENGSYSRNDFCTNLDGDASLAKYFDSWLRLKKGKYTKQEDGREKTSKYIFFTNRGVESSDGFLEDVELIQDEFLFKDLSTKTLRFKKGANRNEFLDAIRAYSEEVSKVKLDVNSIKLDSLSSEIQEAVDYLQAKLKEFNKSKKPRTELKVDGRSALSKKAMALIKLSFENETIKAYMLGEMDRESGKLIESHKSKISVAIDNPVLVLANVMQKEIEEFLDEFVIKVEQPNRTSLMQVVAKELRLDVSIAPSELFHALNRFMLDWFSERHECLLKSNTLGEFIVAVIGDLHRFYLLGATKFYEEESKNYHIDLIGLEAIGVKEFLETNEPVCPIAIINDGGGIKPRVYQAIELYGAKHDLKDAEWAFLTLNSPNLSQLSIILRGDSTRFLVIDCRVKKDFFTSIAGILLNVFKTAIEHNKKILLLVDSSTKEEVKELISKSFSDRAKSPSGSEEPISEFSIEQLTEEQLSKICKRCSKKFLTLGGKQHQLSGILGNKESGIYQLMRNLDFLCNVLKSLSDKEHNFSSGLPYEDIYVANDLVEGIPCYNLEIFLKGVHARLFIIEGIKRRPLSSILGTYFNKEGKERFVEGDAEANDETQYRLVSNLSSLSESKEKLIYILKEGEELPDTKEYIQLKVVNVGLSEVIIINNPFDFDLPVPLRYDFTGDSKRIVNSSSKSDSGFSVLSANAGYGKSAFCLNQRYGWRQGEVEDSSFWVIRLNLPRTQFPAEGQELSQALSTVFTKASTEEVCCPPLSRTLSSFF